MCPNHAKFMKSNMIPGRCIGARKWPHPDPSLKMCPNDMKLMKSDMVPGRCAELENAPIQIRAENVSE